MYGYRILPRRPGRAVFALVGWVALVTVVVLITDGIIFRHTLPVSNAHLFSGPDLIGRVGLFTLKAMLDEVAFRLFVMAAIIAVGGWLVHDGYGEAAPFVFVIAILAAQALNLGLQLPPPPTAREAAYDLLHFYFPGVVWGWLCWRHGFVSAFVGHPLTLLALQPLLPVNF
jgi:hypothetical protein